MNEVNSGWGGAKNNKKAQYNLCVLHCTGCVMQPCLLCQCAFAYSSKTILVIHYCEQKKPFTSNFVLKMLPTAFFLKQAICLYQINWFKEQLLSPKCFHVYRVNAIVVFQCHVYNNLFKEKEQPLPF